MFHLSCQITCVLVVETANERPLTGRNIAPGQFVSRFPYAGISALYWNCNLTWIPGSTKPLQLHIHQVFLIAFMILAIMPTTSRAVSDGSDPTLCTARSPWICPELRYLDFDQHSGAVLNLGPAHVFLAILPDSHSWWHRPFVEYKYKENRSIFPHCLLRIYLINSLLRHDAFCYNIPRPFFPRTHIRYSSKHPRLLRAWIRRPSGLQSQHHQQRPKQGVGPPICPSRYWNQNCCPTCISYQCRIPGYAFSKRQIHDQVRLLSWLNTSIQWLISFALAFRPIQPPNLIVAASGSNLKTVAIDLDHEWATLVLCRSTCHLTQIQMVQWTIVANSLQWMRDSDSRCIWQRVPDPIGGQPFRMRRSGYWRFGLYLVVEALQQRSGPEI